MEQEHISSIDTPAPKRAFALSPKVLMSALTLAVALIGSYVAYQNVVPQSPPLLPEVLRESRFGTVATVNGDGISRERYNSALAAVANLAATNGISLEDTAVLTEIKNVALTSVIENEVLLQAARTANVTVDDATIEEQILATSIQIGGKDAFEAELEKAGVTEKAYRTSVFEQALLSSYIAQAVPTSTIAISDDAVKAFYKERTALAEKGTEIPAFDEVKDQVRAYLENTEHETLVRAHIEALVAAATIEKHITIEAAPVATSTEEVPTE